MSSMLKVGDVFELKKGMEVYAKIPSRFVYMNRQFSNKKTEHNIKVGETLDADDIDEDHNPVDIAKEMIAEFKSEFEGVKFDVEKIALGIQIPNIKQKKFDTSYLLGEYLVVKAFSGGGGTGHGPYDIYPDGWMIKAKKMKNGQYDENGEEISFYQSGCFNTMNENVPVIRKMKMTFS